MYKICVITATRAEYGLLRPLLFKLNSNSEVELCLVVTGTHLSEKYGNTEKEIEEDGFRDYIRVDIPLDDDSKKGMGITTGVVTEKFSVVFSKICPDIAVILGDRFEMLGVAIAAHLVGVPIAHMCGGDVTEGAVDDAIRHCITKLSYLHFPGCEESAKRIIQMGENPERVFNVGEPGIENCLNIELLKRDELARQLNFEKINDDYCVVTFHPVTMEDNTAEEQVYELIKAMDHFSQMSYIITKANADAGGRIINEIWNREAIKRKQWLVVSSLGMLRYLSAVKNSKLVIGNSSSGLVEVPLFKIPTINIGDRQKGRTFAESVINCEPKSSAIVEAIEQGLSDSFRIGIKDIKLPFGDGSTSEKIIDVLMEYLKKGKIKVKKKFYDIKYDIEE